MMGKSRFGVPLLLAMSVTVMAAFSGPAAAQTTGDIKGHVQDAQGQALSGVKVKLLQAGKSESREAATDAEGNFNFEGLDGGVYIATIAMEGYGPVTCPGLRIVGVTRQLKITLMPSGGEQASSCRQAE